MTEQHLRITSQFVIPQVFEEPARGYEVLIVKSGEANGWTFKRSVLQQSVDLWTGAEVFVDHSFWGRSVRDLAGVISNARWSDEHDGIIADLRPVGPSSEILRESARIMLTTEPKPKLGFSADMYFTAKGHEAESILKVNSVDLVIDPAFATQFLRELYAQKGISMTLPIKIPPVIPDPDPDPEVQAFHTLLDTQGTVHQMQQDAQQVRTLRLQMCSDLLTTGLAASKLPAPVSDRIRKDFQAHLDNGHPFEPSDLQAAIDDARTMLSELTAAQAVIGPTRVGSMFSSNDQLEAGVDDLFGLPREERLKNVKPARLTGIRELYFALTGDIDLHGGFHAERIQLATTADFTGLVKNALNKIVAQHWEQLGRAGYSWWQAIASVEHFNSLNSITGTLIGTVGDLPIVAENAEYTELAVGDSPETASFVKYGGYIPLSLELIDRDETRKLKAYGQELANSGLRKISKLCAAIFTDNSGIGPTMADTGALFNTTAVTTKGGHKNLLTTALAAAEWEVVSKAVYIQPMLVKQDTGYYGTGSPSAVSPRYLLVPRALQLTAMKILYPTIENAANIFSENLQRGQPGDVLTIPEWTDATDWAAVCDPKVIPSIFVGERFGMLPEIYVAGDNTSPAVFTNDEHRIKVRHFLAVWVNDFRPLHKSNVAG